MGDVAAIDRAETTKQHKQRTEDRHSSSSDQRTNASTVTMSYRQKAAQLNQRKRRNLRAGPTRTACKPDSTLGNHRFRMTAGRRRGSPIASSASKEIGHSKKRTSGTTEKKANSGLRWVNRRTRKTQRHTITQRWELPRRSLRSNPVEISSDEENQELGLNDYPATRTRRSKSNVSRTGSMRTLRKTQRHVSSGASETGLLPFSRSRTKSHSGLAVIVEESSFDAEEDADDISQSGDSSASSCLSFTEDEEEEEVKYAQERGSTGYRLRARRGGANVSLISVKSTDTEQGSRSRRASQRQRQQTEFYGRCVDGQDQAKAHPRDDHGGRMMTTTPAITTRGRLKLAGQRLELDIYGSEGGMKKSRNISLRNDASRCGTKRKRNNDEEEGCIRQPVATRRRRCAQQEPSKNEPEGESQTREGCATRKSQRRLANRLLPLREDQGRGAVLKYKPLLLDYESRCTAGMAYKPVHFGTSLATAEKAIQKATARFTPPRDDPEIYVDKLEYKRSLRSHSCYEDQEKLSILEEDSVGQVVCEKGAEHPLELEGIDVEGLAARPIMFAARAHRGLKDLSMVKEDPWTEAIIPSICAIDTIRPETAKEALVELNHSIQFVTDFNSSDMRKK